MEAIYPIIFFIAPGILVRCIYNLVEKPKHTRTNMYEFLGEMVIDSVIVFIFTAKTYEVNSITELIRNLDNVTYFLSYAIWTAFLSFVWYLIKYKLWVKVAYWLVNKCRKDTNIKYDSSRTVWENFLGNSQLMSTWLTVSIYRDGEYVTTGMIERMNCANDDFEFHLTHTERCKELYKNDREAFYAMDEFYNIEKSLRIVFYDDERIYEHWKKYFKI